MAGLLGHLSAEDKDLIEAGVHPVIESDYRVRKDIDTRKISDASRNKLFPPGGGGRMDKEKIRKARENIESVLTSAGSNGALLEDELNLLDEAEKILVEMLKE
jgi:hypothetical protein